MAAVVEPHLDWLVYDADHVAGHVLCASEREARQRAIDLARAHHGRQFWVFRYVHGYVAQPDPPSNPPAAPAAADALAETAA